MRKQRIVLASLDRFLIHRASDFEKGFFPAGETRDVLYEIQEIGMPGSGNLPNWNYSLVLYWYE